VSRKDRTQTACRKSNLLLGISKVLLCWNTCIWKISPEFTTTTIGICANTTLRWQSTARGTLQSRHRHAASHSQVAQPLPQTYAVLCVRCRDVSQCNGLCVACDRRQWLARPAATDAGRYGGKFTWPARTSAARAPRPLSPPSPGPSVIENRWLWDTGQTGSKHAAGCRNSTQK
jgi:hypothetical protein